jgi:Na+/melibiose symporter-like transporter
MAGNSSSPGATKARGELSLARLLAFAAPALPVAVFQLPYVLVVPKFYADNVELSVATIGFLIFLVRAIDAITDPLVGYYADHSRPKWGRRRTWFLAAALPTTLGALMVFNLIPDVDEHNTLFWGSWFFGWSVMMSIGYTALSLSHQSWAAEIATSYLGRNRVFAAREVAVVVGTLIATGMPYVLTKLGWHGLNPVMIGLSVIVGLFLPLLAGIAFVTVPEPPHTKHAPTPFFEGLKAMWENGPFRRLLVAFALSYMANGIPAGVLLWFVRDFIHGNEETQRLFLLLYFLFGVLSTPLWLWISKRTSKHRAWSIAMLLASSAFVFVPFVGYDTLGDKAPWVFGLIMVISGMAVGADLMLPPSMQADVIDVDTAKTGEQHSGFYFAIWALATKVALAVGLGLSLVVLGAVGFDKGKETPRNTVTEQIQTIGPDSFVNVAPFEAGKKDHKARRKAMSEAEVKPIKQTPFAMWTLVILYAWVPVLLKLIAVRLVWNFPIGAQEQERLRREIEAQMANGNGSGHGGAH